MCTRFMHIPSFTSWSDVDCLSPTSNGADYGGHISTTTSGQECQVFLSSNSQSPFLSYWHKHGIRSMSPSVFNLCHFGRWRCNLMKSIGNSEAIPQWKWRHLVNKIVPNGTDLILGNFDEKILFSQDVVLHLPPRSRLWQCWWSQLLPQPWRRAGTLVPFQIFLIQQFVEPMSRCFTTDPNQRWEYCDVPVCGSGSF